MAALGTACRAGDQRGDQELHSSVRPSVRPSMFLKPYSRYLKVGVNTSNILSVFRSLFLISFLSLTTMMAVNHKS